MTRRYYYHIVHRPGNFTSHFFCKKDLLDSAEDSVLKRQLEVSDLHRKEFEDFVEVAGNIRKYAELYFYVTLF